MDQDYGAFDKIGGVIGRLDEGKRRAATTLQ